MENSDNVEDDSMAKNSRVIDTATKEENITNTKIMVDIKTNSSPIVEYAEEPLLPLTQACASLIDIVHNLLFYVQMALDETPKTPPNGLTVDESAAIRLYTIQWEKPHESLHSILNQTLRNGDRDNLRPYFKYMKLFLTALLKLPCIPPSTVYRGVTKDLSAEYSPGSQVTWREFSSCTTALTVLENTMFLGNTGNRTLFSVKTISGRSIRAHSHHATDDDVILLPGTHMIIRSHFSPSPSLHIIALDELVPEETPLELPFEGARLYPKRRRRHRCQIS